LADIDPESFNLSPEETARKVTERTRVIMPVHIAGLPCDLTPLRKLARQHKLRMVHDAAHAIGAEYRGRKIGAIPDISSFSFYATKNITTGEGGMVTTSLKKWAVALRSLRLHGMDRPVWSRHRKSMSWYYEIGDLGYKYNLADLNASIGLAQFEEFEKMQKQRAIAAQWYDELLQDMDEVRIPPRNEHSKHAWHLYIIRIEPGKLTIHRNDVIAKMAEAGVACGVHFIPIFMHPYYRRRYGLSPRDFPNTSMLFERIITLPLFPGIRKWEVVEVVRRLKTIICRNRRV
jgi:perosamine synthetase